MFSSSLYINDGLLRTNSSELLRIIKNTYQSDHVT